MIPLKIDPIRAIKHFDSVEKKVKDKIETILRLGRLSTADKLEIDSVTRKYLEQLEDKCLQILITAEPKEFLPIIGLHRSLNKQSNVIINSKVKETVLSKVLKNVFIDNGYEKLEKYDFVRQFKIDTCPYCNRNYIYSFERESSDKKGSVKPQIDHFYPKDKYPYLGISFYNLIPSCLPCNGTEAKHNKDPKEEKMKSPYEISHADFHFSVGIRGLDFSKNGLNASFELEMDKKIEGNVRVFHLDGYYQLHKDHAAELILKSELEYSKSFRESLSNIVGLTFDKSEIDRMIVGNYTDEKDLHKRPLSKMYRDIAIDLGLI